MLWGSALNFVTADRPKSYISCSAMFFFSFRQFSVPYCKLRWLAYFHLLQCFSAGWQEQHSACKKSYTNILQRFFFWKPSTSRDFTRPDSLIDLGAISVLYLLTYLLWLYPGVISRKRTGWTKTVSSSSNTCLLSTCASDQHATSGARNVDVSRRVY